MSVLKGYQANTEILAAYRAGVKLWPQSTGAFSPLDLNPLAFWDVGNGLSTLAANDDGTGGISVDQGVGYIEDLSGNGNHLTQSSVSHRPKYRNPTSTEFTVTDTYIAHQQGVHRGHNLPSVLTLKYFVMKLQYEEGDDATADAFQTIVSENETDVGPMRVMLNRNNAGLFNNNNYAVSKDGTYSTTILPLPAGPIEVQQAAGEDFLVGHVMGRNNNGTNDRNWAGRFYGAAFFDYIPTEAQRAQLRAYFT